MLSIRAIQQAENPSVVALLQATTAYYHPSAVSPPTFHSVIMSPRSSRRKEQLHTTKTDMDVDVDSTSDCVGDRFTSSSGRHNTAANTSAVSFGWSNFPVIGDFETCLEADTIVSSPSSTKDRKNKPIGEVQQRR